MPSMHILVTGGAGFVGSHLCKRLVSEGYSVVAIDNLSNGKESNIINLIEKPQFEFIKLNVNDVSKLTEVFEKHPLDMVFHLAANADVYKGAENYRLDFYNTFMTTMNVLELMNNYGVRKLFFASSSTIYGNEDVLINERSVMKPISHYGAAKMASEAFISSFSRLHDIQVWVARFCNVVGPNMTHGVIPDFIKKIKDHPKELCVYGDGTQTKPYIYIDDLLDGIICMLKKSNESYNAYLIGVESTITVKRIAEIVMGAFGYHAPIRYEADYKGSMADVSNYQYDVKRLQRLGWNPQLSSEEAIRKAVKLNKYIQL